MLLEKISKLAKEKNISISQIEKECNLGNGTIRGWDKSSPSIFNLKKVADFFNLDINYFIKED